MASKWWESSFDSDTLFRALIIAVLAFAGLCALLLSIVVPLIGAVFAVGIAMAVAVIYSLARWRESRREATLWALALASEQEMSLSQVLEGLAGDDAGAYASRLRRLAHLLETGAPLPEALKLVPGTIPREAEPLVRAGWDSSQLAPALQEAAASIASRRPQRGFIGSRLTYFGFVFVLMQVIVWFLTYFIQPKFLAIFHDFDTPLPRITQLAVEGSQLASANQVGPFLMLAILVEALFLLALPILLAQGWHEGIPLVDRLLTGKHSSTILRALAWEINAGRPLFLGIASLARHYPSRWVRGQLELVLQDLEQGTLCWDALQDRRLLRAVDHALLNAADRVGNLPWAMRQLAEASERRFDHRLRISLQTISTLLVIVLGVFTLFVALAYFSPVITLILRQSHV